jgi:uncharacterized membrane protein YeaQ/YmgE (transglycosylase-associated protein family)
MVIDILLWVVFGALAGWIASMIMKTNGQMGALSNIVVGIVGAFIGGFVVRFFTGMDTEGFNLMSLIVAVIGAIILLALVKAVQGQGAAE